MENDVVRCPFSSTGQAEINAQGYCVTGCGNNPLGADVRPQLELEGGVVADCGTVVDVPKLRGEVLVV